MATLARRHLTVRSRLILVAGTATLVAVSAPVVLATYPGRDGRIAFQAQTSDGTQIFTMNRSGGDIRQLTQIHPREGADNPGAAAPDWSPDGRTIAFTVNDCQVGVVSADGGPVTIIPSPPGRTPGVDYCEGDPAFLPDGQHVLIDVYDPVLDMEAVSMVRLDGSDRGLVTAAGGPDPNTSPDGSMISFKGADGALFVANRNGTGVHRVSPDINVSFKHDWAPDGRHLVFSDYADPDPTQPVNVWTVRPDGTHLRAVTHFRDPLYRAYAGGYSPDGLWIVLRLEDRHRSEAQGLSALYLVHSDGTAMHRITPWSSFRPRNLDWGTASLP
jgi:Tol biopolymer transport system component